MNDPVSDHDSPQDPGLPVRDQASHGLIPASTGAAALVQKALEQLGSVPDIVQRAGALEVYVSFFLSKYENPNTRRAYKRAVDTFLLWCDGRGLELNQLAPAFVGMYRDEMEGSVAKKRQALSALRKFFDVLVERHFVQLNPARSTENPKEKLEEGKTPLLPFKDAVRVLRAIDKSSVVGLRDFSIIAVLASTGCRIGAVSKLRRADFFYSDGQWNVRLSEKGSKIRNIPVRHDLQEPLLNYLESAGVMNASDDAPVFRPAHGRTKTLRDLAMTADDMGRMLTRRLCDVGIGEKKTVRAMVKGKLRSRTIYKSQYSPHSLRVAVVTDLLDQGEDIHDVAFLVGHSSTRTTQLYDRRNRKVKRNLVERIRVDLETR